MLTALIWIVAILLAVFVVKALCDHGREQNQKKQEEKEARLRTYKEDLEKKRIQRQAEYDARVKEFSDKYGACDVDLRVKYNTYSIESHIYVYDKSSMLILLGEEIPYNKIVGCSLVEVPEVTKKAVTEMTEETVSKTSTGSMLGRALVGGVLLGPVGAVVGGATAKRKTEATPVYKTVYKDEVKIKYVVQITVNDLNNPVRSVMFGSRKEEALHLESMVNLIIAKTKSYEK